MSGRSVGGLAALRRARGLGSGQLRLVGFHKCDVPLWKRTKLWPHVARWWNCDCWVFYVLCLLPLFAFLAMCQRPVCILLQSRVIAVLDWELSTFGHPLTDLAHLSLFYFWPRTLPMLNGGSPLQENTGTEEQLPTLLFISILFITVGVERHKFLEVLWGFWALKLSLIHLADFLNLTFHFL